jgi:helix-turn-helix protein
VKLPATIAAAALALQVAGAPPAEVARAYAVVAERRPDIIARQDSKYGRKDLLHWQATFAQALTRTETAVYDALLDHYNHQRRDAFPGYERIAELAKCCRRTAIRAVLVLEVTGFVTVERRFRLVDRWDGLFRHDRTNVYRFADGAPAEASAPNGEANEASCDAPGDPTAPSRLAPDLAPTPPRPTAPCATPPAPSGQNTSAPRATSFAQPTGDPYWDVFEAAFVLEHRAAYGSGSTPGAVRQDHLREQTSNSLNELASECVAWGRDPERRLDVRHLLVAEDLARRLARAWIRLPGRDNRHRDRGHPLGWMCGDLTRTLCDEAVEGWKRAQRRLLPKPAPEVRSGPTPPAPPDEAAIKLAENTAVMRLVRQGVDFDQALRLGRAEGARVRAALGLANPSLISPAAAELLPHLVERAGRPPPE